jgi:putative ABC transport system ATP-binding protein
MAMVRGVSAPPEAAVAAVGLRKVYGQGGTSVVALNDVDVTFSRGSSPRSWVRPGPGKSTLLHCLDGLDTRCGCP